MLARDPDIVAFQEVTEGSRSRLRELLRDGGLVHIVDSFGYAAESPARVGPRRYGVILASRFPLIPDTSHAFAGPWPERILPVQVSSSSGPIVVVVVYAPPGSSHGWIKIETFEALFAGLAHRSSVPRILCGDFNTPQEERLDGRVVTWGERVRRNGEVVVKRTIRGRRGDRWDLAERRIVQGLAEFDLPDVYRALHGYEACEFSWFLNRRGRLVGRRFDHVFASKELRPISCGYIHQLREVGLSDHSAIEAEFRP